MKTYPHSRETAGVQARILLKNFRKGDERDRQDAIARLRRHPALAAWSDSEFAQFANRVQLKHARHVVALEWGFESWAALADAHQRRSLLAGVYLDTIEGLRGTFEFGYTEDDVERVCEKLTMWVGTKAVIVWEYWDGYGAGGNSDLHSVHETPGGEQFGPVPAGLWDFLSDPDSTVDPHAFFQAKFRPYSDGEAAANHFGAVAPREVTPFNYALRVAGDVPTDDMLILEHAGVRVFHTYSENHPDMISGYYYQVGNDVFDVRDLPTWNGTDKQHAAVVRAAIDAGYITADGLVPLE